MEQRIIPAGKPRLEDVRQQFAKWRKSGRPRLIPESLWEGAVGLCADHSISGIARALRLDYAALKRRVCSGNLPGSLRASDFVELDWKTSLPGAECILEMEKDGLKMRMSIKGETGLHPLEVMKAFWGQGR